jgi:uncharacterized protein (DUF1684 family)
MVQIHLGPLMTPASPDPHDVTDLLDWKRRIAELYAQIRAASDPVDAWSLWRATRDEMFASHPQSPLPATRREFGVLPYFDYDPVARVEAVVEHAPPESHEIETSGSGTYVFTRVARARFELYGNDAALELYWLEGYGGGLFLSFRDATSGVETYGAGRYLLDTVKGADLGTTAERKLVLDFNFAYNPSCAYDPSWVCPLAPAANRLPFRVAAGERYSVAGAAP